MFRTRLTVVLVLICLFLLGTMSAPTSEGAMLSSTLHIQETVRFAVIGDFGSAEAAEKDVAELVKSWKPEFIITTGDNNYSCGSAKTIDKNIGQYYREYIYPYKGKYPMQGLPVVTENRFFPTLGNHDWGNPGDVCPGKPPKGCGKPSAKAYLDYFTLPGNERYYDFIKGSVHFFALNTDCNEPDGNTVTSKQAEWLRKGLAASTARWKVVYFHEPPYSSREYRRQGERMRWPFKAWGATVIISGHAHHYERFNVEDLTYFVNGIGGAGLRRLTIKPPLPGSIKIFYEDHGAMLVTASANTITFKAITRKGKEIDACTITAIDNTTFSRCL
jgi:predicted phosphodiesterase